jgi:HEPN domain-containing protein
MSGTESLAPDDPREWLRRARSNLAYALANVEGVLLEDRAFNAQQAAEKALKAVLLHFRIDIPFTHDIRELMNRLEGGGATITGEIADADELTPYAVAARYPSATHEPVTAEELERALELAKHVVRWAESVVRPG